LSSHVHPPHLHSFPTRRSSDLKNDAHAAAAENAKQLITGNRFDIVGLNSRRRQTAIDRTAIEPPDFRAVQRRRLRAVTQVRLRRSEEHTSELQSRGHLVCRLLL